MFYYCLTYCNFPLSRCLCQISLRIKSKKGGKLQSHQKESTTKKYIYIYICYTSWRLFSSMMYELYEPDTPYEWVLQWYIRVSAYLLTFIFLHNFIFKKLWSKHLSSSSSTESLFFNQNFKITPSSSTHYVIRICITSNRMQSSQKNIRLKKNVKP